MCRRTEEKVGPMVELPTDFIRCFKSRVESCDKVTNTRDNTTENVKIEVIYQKMYFVLYFTSLLERHPSSSIYCLTHKADLQNVACHSKCYIKNHLIAQCHYKVFFEFNSIRKCFLCLLRCIFIFKCLNQKCNEQLQIHEFHLCKIRSDMLKLKNA